MTTEPERVILSEQDLRRMRGGAAVIIGTFAATTGWAIVASPTWEALRASAPPAIVLDAPFPPRPPGTWQGEPQCIPDGSGDATALGAAEQRGGEGDITELCAEWADRLAVEVTMDVAITQQDDDLDQAELRLRLDTDEDRTDDLVVRVRRVGEKTTAIIENIEVVEAPCPAAADWRETVVRVETDPTCIAEPERLGISAQLGHLDATEPVYFLDDLPDLLPAADLRDPFLRLPRFGGPTDRFASAEHAVRMTGAAADHRSVLAALSYGCVAQRCQKQRTATSRGDQPSRNADP